MNLCSSILGFHINYSRCWLWGNSILHLQKNFTFVAQRFLCMLVFLTNWMQSGEPITVIIKTLLFISAVSPAPPAPLGHNHLTCQRSTRDWQYSEHVSDFCAATRHSGIMTSHPLLVMTNRVAACCRRSANGSAGAEPRLAMRRRRRRTLEDCSNSSSGPKAPRIHTESNAGGCV